MKIQNIILSTDWWTDCDDLVALRMLTRLHKEGKINFSAVGIDACMEHSAASVNAFLTFDGLPEIPIGIDHEATDYINYSKPKYQYDLIKFPHSVNSNDECPDAAELFKDVLLKNVGKTDIIEIGFPQVLEKLLRKYPDVVREKVGTLWVMGGKWDDVDGKEHNFVLSPKSRKAANYICENWNTPVVFLGWEVSYDVITGGKTVLNDGDILLTGMTSHGSVNGRSSWDPMTVQLAYMAGDSAGIEKAGYTAVRGKASADFATGQNNFVEDSNGSHYYVKKNKPNSFYSDIINNIIL